MLELLAGVDAAQAKVNESVAPKAAIRRRTRRKRAWTPALRPFGLVLDLGLRSRDARSDAEACRPCTETAAR